MKGFAKTRTPNMWRNAVSGRFYAVTRVAGKPFPVQKSLKTNSESVAKLRLSGVLHKLRAKTAALGGGNVKLGVCVEAYLADKVRAQIKPQAYRSCETAVRMIRQNCSGFDGLFVEQFTPHDCQVLCDTLRAKYSASSFNIALWTLRGILKVAVKSKIITENPAMDVKPMKLVMNRSELPNDTQFQNFMEAMRRIPKRAKALDFMRIMALTGHRPESIRRLRIEHVDFEHGLVRWPPVKHNTQFNEVPMTVELEQILRKLVAAHKGDGPLLPIKNPRKALKTASIEAKLDVPMNARMFRHFWTTRALEAGISVPDVAAMRGDKDGGAMLLRTYVHPRLEKLRAAAAKLPGTGPRPEVIEKCEARGGRPKRHIARQR